MVWNPAPKTQFETERLNELRNLNLFDIKNDPDFDAVIRLVQECFNVPVVLISIVEEDEQIFKSCIGVDINSTDRNPSFCSFAIHDRDVFVINDTLDHPNFRHNPLVKGDPKIRFYAGFPLFFDGPEAIGTLCIIDTAPREIFNDSDIRKLKQFGDIIKSLIKLKCKKLSLEDSNNLKSEFLSHVAHEIRTPTSAITGLSRILQNHKFEPKIQTLVNTIATASNSLLDLVNTVLDLGTLDNKDFKLTNERFSINQFFDEIISVTKIKASEKQLGFNVDYSDLDGKFIEGDKTRLKQILINLINNAIKFTDIGAISVLAQINSDSNGNEIEFQIIDTGIGISQDNIQTIFKKYYQANSNGSFYDGTGLGLSITKELVAKMNGNIRVESTPGLGSKFTVTLPNRSMEKPQREDNNITCRNGLNNFKILVAEDYKPNAFLIESILIDYGFDCIVVDTGKKVLDAIELDNFDVILMDVNMPLLNGIETTKIIKNNIKKSYIPIIGLSAHVSSKDRQVCIEAGMNDYVSKPIDTNDLYRKINNALNIVEANCA